MTRAPFKIAFPICEDLKQFCLDQTGPAILLQYAPIRNAAEAWRPSTHGNVTAVKQTGEYVQFTMPHVEWKKALALAIDFHEDRTAISHAPQGALLDLAGRTLQRA